VTDHGLGGDTTLWLFRRSMNLTAELNFASGFVMKKIY